LKTVSVIWIFAFLLLAGDIYGQTVLIRPGSSIGFCYADDMDGRSYTYGLKILFMANKFQRYGVKIDRLSILTDEKKHYLSTGLFLEQVLFNYFNMGIGTIGYINTLRRGENPFGVYSHLGFEYNLNNRFSALAAYQSEFIFRKSFTSNNALLVEAGFKL